MTSMVTNDVASTDDYTPPVKLKKTTNEDEDNNDLYCFECHDEGDVICCDSCPRVYHSKCLGLIALPEGDWTCPECTICQSPSKTFDSSSNFSTMLKFALKRMQSHPQAAPFLQPVDPEQMPEYLDYIIHPMDLETMEKNIDEHRYNSIEAFIADVKWIVHNSVVFNGSQSKFTGIARALLRIARHEMNEIEICSECYLRSAQPKTADWFAEPCSIPHALCWAKMKGYQPWPAKVLRIVNDEVDVRFFGQHDRAWVSINNCFLLSKEYPGVEKKKSNANFEKSLSELQIHIERLKELYGQFTYAPLHIPLSKTKPFKFVSIIDDSAPPSYVRTTGTTVNHGTLRSSVKCAKLQTKRSNENGQEQDSAEPVKRARLLSKPAEEPLNTGSNRIVLRIRKTSEDLSSSSTTTTNRLETLSASNSCHQFTVLIKEPLMPLKEDEETEMAFDVNESDVQLTLNALLDEVETLVSLPESIPTQPLLFAERRPMIKQSRKSRAQQRILPPQLKLISSEPPINESSPPSMETNDQPIQREAEKPSVVKSEPIETDARPTIVVPPPLPLPLPLPSIIEPRPPITAAPATSFLISPPGSSTHLKSKTSVPTAPSSSHFSPTMTNSNPHFAPRISSSTATKSNWTPSVSSNPSTRPTLATAPKRSVPLPPAPAAAIRNSNTNSSTMRMNPPTASFDAFQINPPMPPRRPSNGIPVNATPASLSTRNPIRMPVLTTPPAPPPPPIRPPIDNDTLSADRFSHQTSTEVQMIIKNFNEKFQQLLADFTVKIESALETNRIKYEKELEETRRSYRMSMNELRTITNQQVQEMQKNLELQYWTRISEMRNRYESTLHQQINKSMNGGPR